MNANFSPLALGAGMAAMYFLDPAAGRRRRAMLRDRGMRAGREALDFLDVAARDFEHRAYGLFGEARFRFKGRKVTDDVLTRRVGSKIGRLVSHPRAIGVLADDGRVTLRGPVLASEVGCLLRGVAAIPGVRQVASELEVHRTPGSVPSLQGGRPRVGGTQDAWTPAIRLLAGLAGGAIVAAGLRRGGIAGACAATAGTILAGRAATNQSTRRMLGIGPSRRGMIVRKSVAIEAPIDRVFGFFSNFDNFPGFMRYVKEVRDLGAGRSHWVVAGPGGMDVAWNAVVTRFDANRLLAWKSEPHAAVAHAGAIRFEPDGDHRTRVHVEMTYNPPAGIIGHAVATLFGAHPEREMHEDVLRAKTFLETGHPARDAARRRGRSASSRAEMMAH